MPCAISELVLRRWMMVNFISVAGIIAVAVITARGCNYIFNLSLYTQSKTKNHHDMFRNKRNIR